MEQGQIRCDNIGMTQDTSISALGKGQDGVTNYAFENHNIRVLAVNDNTKFAVTNEKSTKYEGSLFGTFIGGCKLNHYVVLFTKDRNPNNATPDYIYRLDYDGIQVNVLQLYNGNLNFSFDNAIEALGFYESEEIQKVYWVDGVNQNRFINIMTDATVRAGWNDYSFDFQGHIQSVPTVTVEKNYQKAGYLPAGTMQYFISYYNKYGVETCLVWASDLQYCSLSSRGAKADESVSCGFDFKITNIDTNYDFLRIYSCYRSGLNGAVTANIVTDISLAGKSATDVLVYTDLGSNLTGFDSNDIPYVGGQSIIANTLDYKQDTLFLGDIRLPDNSSIDVEFYKESVTIPDLRDANKQAVAIMSSKAISWVYKQVSDDVPVGVYSYKSELRDSQEEIAGFKWREVYRFGIQFMTPTGEWTSAYWIGDKYCDCPPTKITSEALTESCTGVIGVNGTYYRVLADGAPTTWIDADGNIIYSALPGVTMMTPMYSDKAMTTQIGTVGSVGNTIKFPILPDAQGIIKCSNYLGTNRTVKVFYKSDGSYIANAVVDFTKLCSGNDRTYLQNNFIAYRLLVADMDITSRHIVEQGVISPTMFNYADRYYNRPYSIPSWMFRPRVAPGTTTAPINRHYDTLPKQTENNAELQGIMTKSVPGFDKTAHEGDYNAYMLIFGANDGGSYIKWKLIYYNAGQSDQDKVDNLNKIMEVDSAGNPVNSAVFGGNYAVVSSGYIKEVAGKWDKVQGGFVSELTSDVKSKGFDVVLSPAMLPSGGMMKSIAYQKGSAAAIFAVLAMVITAVAAAVASVFTCGAAAAAGAAAIAALATATVTTAVTMSVLTSVLSMVAIAGMAATAAIAQKMDDFKEIDKEMAAKGFLPINIDGHELSKRQNTPHQITEMLKRMFTVTMDGGWATLKNSAQCFNDWTVPFTNDPSTCHGALGMDYNAYVISGPLTFLSAEEEDLKNKQNMFCTDESIVTLNAPDIEDNVYTIDNSEAFNLDLVGVIPVEAAHGEYTMQCTPGLNNSAQVIPNKFVNNPLYTTNILGLVNGNFYQDCHITEASIKGAGITDHLPDMQVVATTALYKQWMWNRETTASLWAPGLTLKSAIDESKLTTPAARIERKLFANLRYSSDTIYYDPRTMEIESPVVCLDSQAMLKAFRFNGNNKFYYENVDTISTYNKPYALVVAGAEWPVIEDDDLVGKANITDPVHIKYRQTPHILLPFKAEDGVHTILPYTAQEQPLTPAQLYGDDLGNIKLAGIRNEVPGKDFEKLSYYSLSASYGWQWHCGFNGGKITAQLLSDVNLVKLCYFISLGFRQTVADLMRELSLSFLSESEFDSCVNTLISKTNIMSIVRNTFSNTDGNRRNYLMLVGDDYYEIYNVPTQVSEGVYSTEWYSIKNTSEKTVDGTTALFSEFVGGSKFTTITWNGIGSKRAYTVNTDPTTAEITSITINDQSGLFGNAGDTKVQYINNGQSTVYVPYGDYLGKGGKYLTDTFAGASWNQVQLPWDFGAVPYMFMGELVKKVFDYGTWMGGTGNYGLQQLVWNVASKAAPVGTFLKQSWGDTFYQRWDCQKTYPYTEDDKNSIVDVLSFMLESHDNLDGRCDINRGLNNLLNLRPMNTIFNRNYSQKDNFFTYKVLDEKFSKKHFEADVLWSLTKNNVDDIDRWTCLVSTNEMSLDGRYGTVRKILNVNDVLVAFQDSAITDIRYNENAALATTSGLPLQMGNTGKVDGYRVISDTTGCHNKFSISKNSAGVFYIDDYNKSFNRFTLNGGNEDLGMRAEFSRWFKNPKNLSGSIWSANSNNAFRASYDETTHDLYLIRDNQCIVFNTLLNKFTSFMDYVDTPLITNMISGNGKSDTFAFRNTYNNARQRIVEIWEMFGGADPTSSYGPQGEYGYIYGQFRPYSMEYRLSPDPLHDSIFTNYIYSADWTDPTKDVDEYDIFDTSARRYTTFDTVEAKNEYQQGIIKMDTQRIGRWPVKSKFRIWRGDIPRNGDTLTGHIYAGDRMRNPWIHLKFEKNDADDSKMTFHDLTVIYYNQYGRI